MWLCAGTSLTAIRLTEDAAAAPLLPGIARSTDARTRNGTALRVFCIQQRLLLIHYARAHA